MADPVVAGFVFGLVTGVGVGMIVADLRRRPRARTPDPLTPGTPSSVLRGEREIIKRRTEAKVTPEGLTITVDGQVFHRLEDLPDPVLADQVRDLLRSTTASVEDPAKRAEAEQELRDAGIEPGA